jgi:2-oxoglutarate dehydrogenase E2 component (dihydrolipoamide succinyltransferase)
MASDVAVPTLGESITEAVLQKWLKQEGEQVAVDEPICELETDKATVDLPAPASGVLHHAKKAGETARVGEVIARIDGSHAHVTNPAPRAKAVPPPKQPNEAPLAEPPSVPSHESRKVARPPEDKAPQPEPEPKEAPPAEPEPQAAMPTARSVATEGSRRVPMSKIRRRIAERMVQVQQTAAMLTTFNEIDMTAVQDVRKRHQEDFQKAHGVSLGIMSFFARAAVLALKQFPILNASLDGNDIVYHDYVHLGIAVSTDRGLVVPVLRNCQSLSLARIEGEIKRVAAAAREGKLSIEELSGGTFTITNGGIFGSLLSTPILSAPQSGILGMHAIQDRPVGVDGQIVLRPMMYVALTYDHRLIDGRDSVSFLVRLKHLLENPMQMLLEI